MTIRRQTCPFIIYPHVALHAMPKIHFQQKQLQIAISDCYHQPLLKSSSLYLPYPNMNAYNDNKSHFQTFM